MLKLNKITKIYDNKKEKFTAVKDISFRINENEILGLIGDSGSGKSTIGQIICGLIKPTEGFIFYKDNILKFPIQKELRKDIQILFQHPEISFNPKLKIFDSIKEVYILYRKNWKKEDIIKDISVFGLREEHLYRYPNELSGGELQRLALARVLVCKPKILVLDEPTSMLDVISQAQIISMLREYKKEHKLSYLFISHHIELAKQFCDRILKLEDGKLEELI